MSDLTDMLHVFRRLGGLNQRETTITPVRIVTVTVTAVTLQMVMTRVSVRMGMTRVSLRKAKTRVSVWMVMTRVSVRIGMTRVSVRILRQGCQCGW